jgi:hypothetical protein
MSVTTRSPGGRGRAGPLIHCSRPRTPEISPRSTGEPRE